jgi:hypothetical protein
MKKKKKKKKRNGTMLKQARCSRGNRFFIYAT